MKNLMLASLLVLVLLGSAAAADDYNNALKTAKKENKHLLLYFFSKSCYYCTLMDKNTLADTEIDTMLKRDFIFLRIDSDKSEQLSRLYAIRGTPTSYFLDPSGKRVFEAPGYVQKPTYRKVLEYVKGKYYNEIDLQAYLKKADKK